MDANALLLVASLCTGGTHQALMLDPVYYFDTKRNWASKYSIRYAMHEPEREFRYLQFDRHGEFKRVYRVRVNIPDEMAKAGKRPPMPAVIEDCCPVFINKCCEPLP